MKTDLARQPGPKTAKQNTQAPVQHVARKTAYRRIKPNPNRLAAADLRTLQRAVGNRGVQRLLTSPVRHLAQSAPVIQKGGDDEKEAAAIQKLKSEITTKFSFKSVEDGDKAWTSADLTTARDALAMIPATDLVALKGVVLKRVVSLGGKTAGRFGARQAVEDTTVTNDATLELADLAFQGNDVAEKMQTIQHEVGHAIASLPTRTARQEQNQAIAESNRKVTDTNATVVLFNAANDEYNAAVDAYNAKVKEYNAAVDVATKTALKLELDQLKKEMEAKRAARAAQEQAFKQKEAAQKAAETVSTQKKQAVQAAMISQTDLKAIRATADTAKISHDGELKTAEAKATPDLLKSTEAAAYYENIKAASQSITGFFDQTKDQTKDEATVDGLIATTTTALDERAAAFNALQQKESNHALLTQFNALERSQDKFFEATKANALAHERSARVQTFVKFVESKKIPPITTYARENWPHKPEEFYAEAYSYWTSKKLAAVSAELDAWFTAGNYKK